jgi:hypothetical protein
MGELPFEELAAPELEAFCSLDWKGKTPCQTRTFRSLGELVYVCQYAHQDRFASMATQIAGNRWTLQVGTYGSVDVEVLATFAITVCGIGTHLSTKPKQAILRKQSNAFLHGIDWIPTQVFWRKPGLT